MGLDTREHTIKHKKYLSKKQIKEIKKKIEARTATMEEYKNKVNTFFCYGKWSFNEDG